MLCTISYMLYTVVYMLCVCCIHGVYILYMLNSNQNCHSSQSVGAIATESRAVHMGWTSLGTGMINMVRACVNSIHCSLLPQWLTPDHHWVYILTTPSLYVHVQMTMSANQTGHHIYSCKHKAKQSERGSFDKDKHICRVGIWILADWYGGGGAWWDDYWQAVCGRPLLLPIVTS